MTSPAPTTSALDDIYRWLHSNPELSFQEVQTASLVAGELLALGFEVVTGIGTTGVAGVLRNGAGPTVLLRADMDALPVLESTGLEYASTARATDGAGRDVPVMHACGHDMHTVCLIGAARRLAETRTAWSGTLDVVFQPAEELGEGALAMASDGLFERIPRPVVVLGQHVSPLAAGTVALQPGPAFAAADGIRITFHGRGGHGSRPETTVDPVVMAAAAVLRLQTIVSRETAATDSLVLTVGSFHAGTKNNVIPESAEILISMRSFDTSVRDRAIDAIRRIAQAESLAAGAHRAPTIDIYESFPAVVNDPAAAETTRAGLEARFGAASVFVPGAVTGSEDVGLLAAAAGAPCSFWLLGGADPSLFAASTSVDEVMQVVSRQPSNHSPDYAPVLQPTLANGVDALVSAATEWFDRG